MKVLICAAEVHSFAATGGLGDVMGALPKALKAGKVSCRVVMPLYSDIPEHKRADMKLLTTFTVQVGWRMQYCGLLTLTQDGIVHYFIDNEYYFKRKGLYGFYDDGERYTFFSLAVLEMLKHIAYTPDIVHCNDWQTAMVAVYLNAFYREDPKYGNIKTLFTIHNIQYQGKFGYEMLGDTLGLAEKHKHLLDYAGNLNFMKGAIQCADWVNTVSPTYAQEICDPWYAHGLDGFLRESSAKLSGILNGIDTHVYDPATDKMIAAPFSAESYSKGKALCKTDLQKQFNLEVCDKPLIGIVTRLVSHKGIDLVVEAAQQIINAGAQLAVLGSGEHGFEQFFESLSAQNRGSCGVYLGYAPAVARKTYAGADMFLMPSKSEPCGLAQMVALRYGTIPIVRETGGLKDSIKDLGGEGGNGFTFKNYYADDMLNAINRALELYADKKSWGAAVKNALEQDFSWGASAKQYAALYKRIQKAW